MVGDRYGHGFFFPFGFFLFPLFIFGAIFLVGRAFRGPRGSWGHDHGPGYGPWSEEGRARFEDKATDWHRRQHEQGSGRLATQRRRRRDASGMTTVLVVEDEIEIARVVRDYLRNAGFEVIVVGDGGSAVASVRSAKPDLLVLDLGLPGRDGLDVAREIRRWSDTPIVMLTARGDETDRIVGLEIGADDYVVKPFSPKELVARVRAVLRRTRTAARGDEVVRAGDVEIDTAKMRVSVGGTQVDLTPTEFQLLATLAREPGRVFTRSQLLDAVHGVAIESYERAIDAHVKNIRRKIEPEPGSPRYVVTVHGVGYRFADA